MFKSTLLLFVLFIALSVSGQEAISTQGDSYSNANGNISFTIGEAVIFTGTDGSHSVTQGFQQSSWTLVGIEEHIPHFDVNIFPNPTEDVLNIQSSLFKGVTYTLLDAQGKIVLQNKLISNLTSIEVSHITPGTYLLQLSDASQKLKSFKLIKSH